MNITLDDSTKEELRKSLSDRNKSAVRVVMQGFGWGGPSFGVVLDEQHDDDEVVLVDDIKITAEKEFSFLLDNAKIIYSKGFFGPSFNVVTGSEGSCG